MARPPVPQHKIAAIVRDFEGEETLEEIGARHGVSARQVYNVARSQGLRRRDPVVTERVDGRDVSPLELAVYEHLSAMARRGEVMPTNVTIGEQMGHHPNSIGHAMRGIGMKGLIRVDGTGAHRRVTILATGEATAGGPPPVETRVDAGAQTYRGTSCTWCGARPDACECGQGIS
ncbi:hypothetical protein [Croceicoccus gelatinilyticus]|uniref:hypothetical protein n=1 Tax=Croceicoccus gelatinilyticus TaxID=2835536 RepID=UPI001BCC73FA|nr:hypothetical protein [Croceicoccus gelatinilyticus]MBS7669356.1 hypothetical protein [Croceicoccus gelatinilyticus]